MVMGVLCSGSYFATRDTATSCRVDGNLKTTGRQLKRDHNMVSHQDHDPKYRLALASGIVTQCVAELQIAMVHLSKWEYTHIFGTARVILTVYLQKTNNNKKTLQAHSLKKNKRQFCLKRQSNLYSSAFCQTIIHHMKDFHIFLICRQTCLKNY